MAMKHPDPDPRASATLEHGVPLCDSVRTTRKGGDELFDFFFSLFKDLPSIKSLKPVFFLAVRAPLHVLTSVGGEWPVATEFDCSGNGARKVQRRQWGCTRDDASGRPESVHGRHVQVPKAMVVHTQS